MARMRVDFVLPRAVKKAAARASPLRASRYRHFLQRAYIALLPFPVRFSHADDVFTSAL